MHEARKLTPVPQVVPPPAVPQDIFHSIFQAAGVGMVLLDAHGDIQQANPAMEAFLGLNHREWKGHTLFAYAHPEEMKDYASSFLSYQVGGFDRFSLDGKYIRRDGATIWGRLTVTVISRSGLDSNFLAVGLMENITQKRQAQARLAESEEKFRSLVSNLPGITYRCSHDRNMALDFISEGVKSITGYPAEDFLRPARRTYSSIIHPGDREIVERAVTDALRRQENFEMQYRLLRSDGTTAYVYERGCGIFSKAGKLEWVDGFIMDITNQVMNLQKIEEQQVRMLAASKLSALGQMSAGIAHEVNNPLAIIHGAASILRIHGREGSVDQDSVLRAAELIQTTSMRISKIIKALRSFAREGQKDPLQSTTVGHIVTDTMEFCRERFKCHSIDMRLHVGQGDLFLLCRSVQISQVLVNLLNNSFDAIEGQPEKWIEIRAVDLGDSVEISVMDNGPGIPANIRSKILMPFFTTKEVGRGTGLGLSISAGIVESHQGTLTLDETSPHTRFVIRLPKRPI